MPPPSSASPPMSSQDSQPPKTKAFKKVPLESYHQMLQCVHNMYRGPSVRFSDKFLQRLMFFANTPAETEKFYDIDLIFLKYDIKPICKFVPQLVIECKENPPEDSGYYRTDTIDDDPTPIQPAAGPSNMVITEKIAFKNCKPSIFESILKERSIGFSGHAVSMDSCKIHLENFEFLALDRHLEWLDLTGVHLSDVMEYEFEEVWKRIQNVKNVKLDIVNISYNPEYGFEMLEEYTNNFETIELRRLPPELNVLSLINFFTKGPKKATKASFYFEDCFPDDVLASMLEPLFEAFPDYVQITETSDPYKLSRSFVEILTDSETLISGRRIDMNLAKLFNV